MLAFHVLAALALQPASPARIAGQRPGGAHAMPRRAALLGASALCAFTAVRPARADEPCMTTCLRECKQLVPGNDGYCMENCQTACAAIEAKESAAGTAPFAPLSASTDIAGRAADDAPDVRGSSESIGIFGRESDSGVEKFAATLFGATKQASDPRVANRDEFVDEVVSSFKSGVMKSR
ncbi:hypothetical protein KFE25_008609 [Diacronema lutheri]|uniref:Uncharacterized protein n=1 Tax=Diacronema lutheri TaxID=2081491 RepID=A0A8J5XR66_DIALT|nr:hypothetical protein KFE25_008609 [Diacronema lutheri]|mmetsp:Transcript_18631/g.58075  ORF Transcript_18631/g.58075 Transcript_18631/m.58075 type:complete len:180 (+) Transcript_18631:49-588(+)